MTTHSRWYGENPTTLRKVMTNGLVLFALSTLYGIYIDFVASELWWQVGTQVALVFSVVLSIGAYWGKCTGHFPSPYGMSARRMALGFVFLPFMLFLMLWMALLRVIPDALTRLFGSSVTVTAPMVAVHHWSRRRCAFRLEGQFMDRGEPGWLCVRESAFNSFPSDVLVTFEGKETIFGIHVQRYYRAESASSPARGQHRLEVLSAGPR